MLIASGVLALVMPLSYSVGRGLAPGGHRWSLGNREGTLEVSPWVTRAQRAHANLVENLPPFTILVLTAHLLGEADEVTALGATIFFFARLAHAVVYVAGIVYVRTLAFLVSLVGQASIFVQIFV